MDFIWELHLYIGFFKMKWTEIFKDTETNDAIRGINSVIFYFFAIILMLLLVIMLLVAQNLNIIHLFYGG